MKTPILSFRSRPNVVFDPIVPDVAFDPIVAIECLETGGARQRAQRAVARQPRSMGPSVEGGRGGEEIDGEPWESAREVLQVGESARVQVAGASASTSASERARLALDGGPSFPRSHSVDQDRTASGEGREGQV